MPDNARNAFQTVRAPRVGVPQVSDIISVGESFKGATGGQIIFT